MNSTDSGDRGGSGLLKAPTPFDYSYFSALVDAPVQEAVGWKLVPTSPTRAVRPAGKFAKPDKPARVAIERSKS